MRLSVLFVATETKARKFLFCFAAEFDRFSPGLSVDNIFIRMCNLNFLTISQL